jgi:hypothetical protein
MEASSRKPVPKHAAVRLPWVDCLIDARATVAQSLVWNDQTYCL